MKLHKTLQKLDFEELTRNFCTLTDLQPRSVPSGHSWICLQKQFFLSYAQKRI